MWAIQHWDVEPDILLTAKGIGSGMPVGAMVAKAEVMSWGPGAHGSTYGGNPVALAALLETIRLLEGGLIANAGIRGRQVLDGLRPLVDRFPGLVKDVRGKGLMIGIQFDSGETADAVQMQAFDRGPARPRGRRRLRPDVAAAGRDPGRGRHRDPDLHASPSPTSPLTGRRTSPSARRPRAPGMPRRASAPRDARVRPAQDYTRRHLIDQERRPMPGKVASMRDAVADLVRDGDTVAIEGFTHLIGFSAGHEIIRQRKRDLTLARMTPDLIYDQMIAGGVARKLIFSWLGNPGVGGLNAIRRRIEPASVGEGTAARGGGVQPLRHGRRATPRAPPTCRSCRCAPTSRRTCRRRTR